MLAWLALPQLLLLALVGVALLGVILWRVAGRTDARATAARARRTGHHGQTEGLAMLRRAGYEIVQTEVVCDWSMKVDGQPHTVRVRVDAIVALGRARYIAELKGGRSHAAATHPATRRQLLEYAVAHGVEGVLLVDVPQGAIRTVTFAGLGRAQSV